MDLHPYDLNEPEDARAYLRLWEKAGNLVCPKGETLADLSDKEAVQLARRMFMSEDLYPTRGMQ